MILGDRSNQVQDSENNDSMKKLLVSFQRDTGVRRIKVTMRNHRIIGLKL